MKQIIVLVIIATLLTVSIAQAGVCIDSLNGPVCRTDPPQSPIVPQSVQLVYLPLIWAIGQPTAQAITLTKVYQQPGWEITSFTRTPTGTLFASAHQPLILKSVNEGQTWTNNLTVSPVPSSIRVLLTVSSTLLAGGYFEGENGTRIVIRSTNNGNSWTDTSAPDMRSINDMAVTPAGSVLAAGNSTTEASIWRSTNQGASWSMATTDSYPTLGFQSLGSTGTGVLLAVLSDGHILSSANDGQTWTDYSSLNFGAFVMVRLDNGHLFTAGEAKDALSKSVNNGLTWTHPFANNYTLMSLAQGETNVLYSVWEGPGTTQTLQRSSNEGQTWTKIADLAGLGEANVRHGLYFAPVSRRILVGTSDGANSVIYLSNQIPSP